MFGTTFDIDVSVNGPLFDAGRVESVMRAFETDAEYQIALSVHSDLLRTFDRFFKNPTGYYASRVIVDMASADSHRVHDSMVVYGGWLEGTSHRNQSTRFKGYASFRRVRDRKLLLAPKMAEQILGGYLGRLGL